MLLRRAFRWQRQRQRRPSCRTTATHHETSHRITPIFPPRHDVRTIPIRSTSSTSISPLLHFESASLHYPPQWHDHDHHQDDVTVESELGLNADVLQFDPDFVLEVQDDALFRDNNNNGNDSDGSGGEASRRRVRQLQRHWNNSIHTNNHHHHDNTDPILESINLQIHPNLPCGSGGGGHILLGRNGVGKTLISRAIQRGGTTHGSHHDDNNNPYLRSGMLHLHNNNDNHNNHHQRTRWDQQFTTHVSFESHTQLLTHPQTTTVHRALIPQGGNRLSPVAQFLTVRLGMYPLLPRHIATLSTGEIRRVLLVRALVQKPQLLLLDNVWDGLDHVGRCGIRDILERVLEGFRMDILVQGVGCARDTVRTQILMVGHRPEEILGGMGRVSFVWEEDEDGVEGRRRKKRSVRTEERGGRSGLELVKCLEFGNENDSSKEEYDDFVRSLVERKENGVEASTPSHPWDGFLTHRVPNDIEINNFWESGYRKSGHGNGVLVEANQLKVIRDDTILLSDLNWTVQRGERWHLAGTNGAGKSTLGRLLLRKSVSNHYDRDTNDAVVAEGSLEVTQPLHADHTKRGGIGWVSTELHLHAAHHWSDRTISEILSIGAGTLFDRDRSSKLGSSNLKSHFVDNLIDVESFSTVLHWLGLIRDNSSTDPFLTRTFGTLSQGQQKLLLIASAIAQRPSLLILDEPCQGLDLWNRARVLYLLHSMCRMTDMSLIYITHHEEELIPSIDCRIRLEGGKVFYCGSLHG
ncbi:hypothetical protein HJC23_000300 [Cyclotella cryptica]|uniref:ABC transporter domain-containing protein n=1 Tax=Cyclotella cryptica TaxID=29204 RepID=A0ABD3NVS0_9STRA|eukprot:CCRYP_019355-RA/>CCRYP_019355-RA protein AED:0.02 eAED:0.02 QI:0/1/0.5/1/1/1/2/754/749